MRKLTIVRLALAVMVLAASSCAPKIVPVPTVTAPKFPDFIQPTVPASFAGTPAALNFNRGWQFLQSGDFKSADREFGLALKASPAFYPAEAAAGYLELARKDSKAALQHFDRALERQPNDTSALVGRGEALMTLAREPEAVAAFEAALASDPSLTDLRRRVDVLKFRNAERDLAAARLAARSGRLDQAIEAYRTAIAHSPESAFLYRELAAVEQQHGDSALALADFRHAVALEPGDAGSLGHIGELLESSGDIEGAIEAYTSSLAIESDEGIAARLEAIRARRALARLPEEYRAIDNAPQITRADLAALIGIRLAAVLQTMRLRETALITDIRGNWAESWIMTVARAGVIEPFANHAYQPRAAVRRADLAQAVSRLLAKIASPAAFRAWQNTRQKFADILASHLAYPAASVAVASGVMTATDEGAFQPNRPVTGQEAVAAVERLRQMANLAGGQGNGAR